jgi:hypothetical protein
VFEGAALSWPLPDIVIRRKGGFANRETQGCQVGADKRVVTPRRIMTSQPAAMVTVAIAQLAPTTNWTRPGGDCHELIQLV